MTQLTMTSTLMAPSAVESRRSGLRRGRELNLREKYLALLRTYPHGITDQDAGVLLGVLATTAGARRIELIESGVLIVAAGRVKSSGRTSRTVWRLA